MAPNSGIQSDPMLPNIRTSLHTTYIKPDPTPSTDPELFDKSTGHQNTHYDHSKQLSKKKKAKLYGTGSPQLTAKQANAKVDRINPLDDHEAREKVDHNKDRDERQEAYDHDNAKSKDATSREDDTVMSKRDEVTKADTSKPARKSSDASKKKSADQKKDAKSSDKSDQSKDKSSEMSDESSEKSESMLGRAANLASGLIDSVKESVANLTGKSDDSSSKPSDDSSSKSSESEQPTKKQKA